MASDSIKAATTLPQKVNIVPAAPPVIVAKPPPSAPVPLKAKVFADELSNGKGSALKTQSAKMIPTLEPTPVQASTPTFKVGAFGLVSTGASSSEGVPPRREEDQQRAALEDWRQISQGRGKPAKTEQFVGQLEDHQHEPAYIAKFIQTAASDGALYSTVTNAWQDPANREVVTASVRAAMQATPPTLNPQKVAAFVQLEAEANETAAVPSTAWSELAAPIDAPKTLSAESTASRTPEQQRTAAEQDYELVIGKDTKGKPVNEVLVVGMLASHANEPDYQAFVVAKLNAQNSLYNTFARVWTGGTPSDQATVLQAVAAARSRNMLGDEQISAAADGSNPLVTAKQAQAWAEIGRGLTPPIDLSSPAERAAAVEKVAGAQKGLATAKDGTKELDAQLQRELAGLGPALSPEQRATYTQKFHDQNSALYAAEATAAKTLFTTLSDPAVQKAVAQDPTGATAKTVFEGYARLADSSYAKETLEWIDRVVADPSSAESKAYQKAVGGGSVEGLKKALDPVVEKATTNAFNQFLVDSDGDVSKAISNFKSFADGKKGLTSLSTAPRGWGGAIEAAISARNGNYSGLAALGNDWAGMSGLDKALAGITVVAGAYGAVDAAMQGKYLDAVKNLVEATKGGAELMAVALSGLAGSSRVAFASGAASGGAAYAARLAPVLGVMANGLNAAVDIRDAAKKKRIGLALAGAAEVLATLTSALGPEAVPVTWFALAIADSIKFVDFVLGEAGDKENRYKMLVSMGFDEKVARGLGYADHSSVEALGSNLGYTPKMIQEFAGRFPDELATDVSPQFVAAGKVMKAFNFSPEQMQDLLNSQLAHPAKVANFFALAQDATSLKGATAEEIRQSFEWEARQTNPERPYKAQTAQAVLDFLNRGGKRPTPSSMS